MYKILIVDDSTDLLQLFSMVFKIKGYEVQTASSRLETLTLLSGFVPDIILLDIRLHGENGRELCREIKQRDWINPIHIILMSASPYMLVDYEECLADGILEKPFELKMVIDKVSTVLNAKKW